MVEIIKTLVITGVMSIVAQAGGRKIDKYFITIAGLSYAGELFIKGVIGFTSSIGNIFEPIAKILNLF